MTYRVEAFKESEAVDEVEALTGCCTDAVDDEVHAVGVAANSRVERAGPRLGIGSELESSLWKADLCRTHSQTDTRHKNTLTSQLRW